MMVDVSVDFARGMTVEVVYTKERPASDPTKGWETVERTETGTITAAPSRKFDWPDDDFDFDYEADTHGPKNPTRSVNLDTDTIRQLHYDAGGDRDWRTFTLEAINVTGP